MNRRHIGFIGLLLLAGAGLGWWVWEQWLEGSEDVPIRAAAEKYGVEPALVKAVVWRESHFHPRARGRIGEIGLMQLRDAASREWAQAEHVPSFNHEQCYDPQTNTLAGTWYLRKLLRRYSQTDNPLPYALADYNAGRQNILKWATGAGVTNSTVFVSQIRFPSTRAYVRAVLRRYEFYRPVFPPSQHS
ncbi:MAG TPA: lytic transglycosylase domain-containing protein [Verrucomicrobiae bacterium]|nr:lytic transglycosylase domain-containing protein [Verrucomicrobiae bacterium]